MLPDSTTNVRENQPRQPDHAQQKRNDADLRPAAHVVILRNNNQGRRREGASPVPSVRVDAAMRAAAILAS